ncbi:MAG: DUF4249 domain-containing protein [Bacteroidota bacterium]
MRRNNIIFLVAMLVLALTSCIKQYEPVINSNDAVKFVVSGQVIKGDQVQHITISTTSPISEPKFFPVVGCTVFILDNKGHSYAAADMLNGNYDISIPESALKSGTSFKVDIHTQEGVYIVSDLDKLNDSPDLDSVYYSMKVLPTNNPETFIKGVQFYVDLNALNSGSRYFRWEAVETYEYHSTWPIEWYYDGSVHHVYPPDYSRFVCWRTQMVKNIFTLSTENLTENRYSHFPLHFVDNYTTPRLVYGYSLLIRQYVLSAAAYAYWEKLRINSSEQGGLYEKQPLAIRGNLRNVTHPDQQVLGFFGASEAKSRRIFVSNVPDLPLEYDPNCAPSEPLRLGFREITPEEYPAYLFGNHVTYFMRLLETPCVDCLTLGGANVKPSFWPN